MGLGWGVDDSQGSAVGLAGGTFGYGCYFYVDIKNRRAIVVTTNYATPGAADNKAVALHLLAPAKFPRKKPSIGRAVTATYRTGGVQASVERYRTLDGTTGGGIGISIPVCPMTYNAACLKQYYAYQAR